MSGGQFDHNLSGIEEGQGAKWDDTAHELVPADFAEYLHELLDVTGTASPTKGALLVGDGTTWRVLPIDSDGKRLSLNSTDPLGVEWVDPASGGGGGSGGASALGPFIATVAASGADSMTLLDGVRESLPIWTSMNTVGLAVMSTPPVTGGEIDVYLTINGARSNTSHAQLTSTNPCFTTQLEDALDACDKVGMEYEASDDLAPETDITGQLIVCSLCEVDQTPFVTGAPSFSPDDIEGLLVWLDADSLSGSLSDDDPVSSWIDKANSEDFSQATGSLQPTFKTNVLNSLPAVRFDSDTLVGETDRTLKPVTMFAVLTPTDAANNRTILCGGGEALQWKAVDAQGDHNLTKRRTASVADANTDLVAGNSYYIDASYSSSGEWLFGNNGSDDGSGTNDMSIASGVVKVGSRDNDGQEVFFGDIHELLIYDNVLSTADRGDVRDYLADRWGL